MGIHYGLGKSVSINRLVILMSDEPGFDFIKLTRPQWRHLARVQRKHGIPWHSYIQILIQRDMSRQVNVEEEIRPAPMEGKSS